ncbi:MAG: serine hydrolase [Acidipila sp.]|nr:serine hydrolase [Acidipila sp.]
MRSRLAFFLILMIFAATPGTHPQEFKPHRAKLSPAGERWVENTLKHMTTDEKVGQVIFPTYFGGFYSTESPDYQTLMRHVESDHAGGFILATRGGPRGTERSTVYATAALTNQLQRKAKIPLLIAADFEHGTVMRIIEGTSFPEPMAVAATGRAEDAYTIGRISALEARAAGVQWLFAPVADVNSNPDNPIINIRSFGEDPKKVSAFVSAFVRGVEENGALATAKHFPGHGDTGEDSHLDLAMVHSNRARLDAVDLVPFRAAIAAGVSSIMTGHLVVPALEPDPELPATLSPKVLTELLRKQMGFDGLIVTDALDMGGVTNHYAPAEVAVRAFAAGADVLLMPPVPDAAVLAMKEAVQTGRVSIERLDDAVRRILRAKARLGLDTQRMVDVDKLNSVYAEPEFTRAAQDIADRGVTLLRDEAKLVPLDARKPLRTLLVAVVADPDTNPSYEFAQAVKSALETVDVVKIDSRYFRPATVTIPPLANYDTILLALTVRVADRKGTVGLPPDQAELVHRLLASGKPAIVASFGSPYLMESYPEAKTWLAVFDTNDVGQRAVARALFGEVAIGGKLPVRLPGAQPHALGVDDGLTTSADHLTLKAASGEMIAHLKPAFDILDRSGLEGIAGTLYVVYSGDLARHSAQVTKGQLPAAGDARAKPYLTTAIGTLLGQKRLTLDTPIFRIMPEWAAGPDGARRQTVTVRHLLSHTSGLAPADARTFVAHEKHLLTSALAVPLTTDPGTAFAYSPWNNVLLEGVLTRLTGATLSEFSFGEITKAVDEELEDKAPRTLAYPELPALGQMWLNGGIFAHDRFLHRAVVEEMSVRRELNNVAFTDGWDCPSPELGTGKYFSARAFGFGRSPRESLWIDPEKELVVVITLTSRDPNADAAKLVKVRSALHDAVIEGLGIAPPH